MRTDKKLLLTILIIVGAILTFTWTQILFTENAASWRHQLAVLLFIPSIFLFDRDFKKAVLFTGIYLMLGSCNLLTLTPAITSNSYGVKIGSLEIWTPTFQLYSFLLLVLYFIVNYNALIEYYLDYQDAKKLRTNNIKSNNKIKTNPATAKDLILQGKQLINLHITGDFEIYQLENNINSEIVIKDCIVDNLVSPSIEFKHRVHIQGSNFEKCSFNYAYFAGGLLIDNCVFDSYVDFEAGGHNQKLILIKNSHFKRFVNFFDCWFQSGVEIINNRFEKGTNILGNKSMPYRVQFDISPLIENNIGPVDLDGEGDKIVNIIYLKNYES